jgi:hypothetical protein
MSVWKTQRFTHVIGILFLLVVLMLLAREFVYQPLKFHFLVWRVESAKTAEEESRAFNLAVNRGRVWEIDRLDKKDWTASFPATNDWLLRLEWLESSPYGGGAYVAFRSVIDTNNLRILWEKKY